MTLLIPIIGVYTGIDFWGKVFLVFAFAVFVILINTEAGVRASIGTHRNRGVILVDAANRWSGM